MDSPQGDNRRQSLLGTLPAIHRLLATPELMAATRTVPAGVLADSARHVLDQLRASLLRGDTGVPIPDLTAIAETVVSEASRRMERSLRRAINATGVVLHTGLGRARLADAAREAMLDIAGAHCTLELDRETGRRGSRRDHVRNLLCELTGAEDATVVNNCAGAVFLAITALAAGREVVISRGELVEIGGAFRMPDIIRASGARLIEVGTTNRTRLADYAAALTGETGLILRCQPSNFAVIGFTEETRSEELVTLGRQHGIPVMDDQGSGAMLAPQQFGLPESKGSLRHSLDCGCDLVTASGDKLLGGPQSGIILGKRALLDRIASNPLSRALRVDKFTLAALEATLCLYREPEHAVREIPTLRYLNRGLPELTALAVTLKGLLEAALEQRFTTALTPGRSQVGGGSLPGEDLPTMCVSLRSTTSSPTVDEIAARFRQHAPPIFARIKADTLLFDPRTLEIDEFAAIVDAARSLI